MTAAAHRRISKRELLAAARHAGLPWLIDGNYAYFVGIDTRGREFEFILAAHDRRRPLGRRPCAANPLPEE